MVIKYKYQKGQRVKAIFPPAHVAFNKTGTIVQVNKKHLILFYFVEFDDKKRWYFGEKELEVV